MTSALHAHVRLRTQRRHKVRTQTLMYSVVVHLLAAAAVTWRGDRQSCETVITKQFNMLYTHGDMYAHVAGRTNRQANERLFL